MTNPLSSFKSFDSFNLIMFSRTPDQQTKFLLRRNQTASTYKHLQGTYTNQEPSILLALAKKFVRKTNGLLFSENLPHFSNDDSMSVNHDAIKLENHSKTARPAKTLTLAVDDIVRLVSESPYYFQDSSSVATYFVQVPLINLDKVNQFAEDKGLVHRFKYFTIEELLVEKTQEVNRSLKEILYEGSELMGYLQKYIVDYEPVQITSTYGVICCEMFLRTYLFHALHFPVFKKHGEAWRFYKAYEKDLPSEEDLKSLKGLIIPGSSFSVYNTNIDWYQGLFALIRKIHHQHSHINLLGICFGAQVIAQALGGKVEKMNRDFIDGGEVLNVESDFYELPYVKNSQMDSSRQLIIAQAHGDHIVELPPMARNYASSESANVEVFTINKNILGFQGHPDYNEIMEVRSSLKNKNLNVRNYMKYEETCVKTKFANPLTQQVLLQICFNFLKQNQEEN